LAACSGTAQRILKMTLGHGRGDAWTTFQRAIVFAELTRVGVRIRVHWERAAARGSEISGSCDAVCLWCGFRPRCGCRSFFVLGFAFEKRSRLDLREKWT
jgi:hypothetical protein